jgi:hypothetical protein
MLLAAVALALAAGAPGAIAASISARAGADGVPALHHVVLIVGENTSFGQITPAHAPYLTGTVKPAGGVDVELPLVHEVELAGRVHRDGVGSVHAVRGEQRHA